ncbi:MULTISPECIES: hypothetical protein [unclassified Peribacillus]
MPCLQKNELACLHLKNNQNKEEINQFISACLAPTASIILIIGAGEMY